MGTAEIGTEPDQLVGDQGEVVVLHEDAAPLGGDLGQPEREELIELAVGVPGLLPPPIDPRPPRRVEQVVVAEPERAVRHQVVGHREDVGIGVDQVDADAFVDHHPETRGHPVGLPECSGNPGCARSGHERAERTGEPPAGGGRFGTALDQVKGEGTAIRHQHGVGERSVPFGPDSVGGHAIDATR